MGKKWWIVVGAFAVVVLGIAVLSVSAQGDGAVSYTHLRAHET